MENETNIKKKVLGGFFWRFSERTAAQVVQFIVSIILARLLTPSDYGLIGLITVFITVAGVFVQSGFGNSLIQQKNAEPIDFSSVFYFNILMGIVMYLLLFITAPAIAGFYGEAQLTLVIRVLAVSLIIGGVNGVQQAYVSRTMQFKRFFFATIIGTIASAAIGIFMAYKGCGVWALVVQSLSNQIIDTVILWVTVKWRPIFAFSFTRMKSMFSYGWKLLASSLLDNLYNNLYSLIIGKFYSASDLGYYNRGKNIPSLVITNINSSIQSVIFPALASHQDNKVRVKAMVRRAIVTSCFLIMPAMAGLAAVSKPLTIILLTEKWLPSVPFMQFSCFILAFWPIHTANLQAINAVGRSDIFLKLEIIKKVIGCLILFITIPMGLYAMMIGSCISSVISAFLNASPNKKLLSYGYLEQLKDIFPSMLLAIFMGVIVWCVELLSLNVYVSLLTQVVFGVGIYVGGAYLLKFECMDYVINMIKEAKKNNIH